MVVIYALENCVVSSVCEFANHVILNIGELESCYDNSRLCVFELIDSSLHLPSSRFEMQVHGSKHASNPAYSEIHPTKTPILNAMPMPCHLDKLCARRSHPTFYCNTRFLPSHLYPDQPATGSLTASFVLRGWTFTAIRCLIVYPRDSHKRV